MAEVINNSIYDPTTTLNGAINNSTTTVIVHDASEVPTPGDSRILVWDGLTDSTKEIMKVTAVASNTLTVVRAAEGPLAAQSHADGDKVELVVTKASIENLITQGSTNVSARLDYLTAR